MDSKSWVASWHGTHDLDFGFTPFKDGLMLSKAKCIVGLCFSLLYHFSVFPVPFLFMKDCVLSGEPGVFGL